MHVCERIRTLQLQLKNTPRREAVRAARGWKGGPVVTAVVKAGEAAGTPTAVTIGEAASDLLQAARICRSTSWPIDMVQSIENLAKRLTTHADHLRTLDSPLNDIGSLTVLGPDEFVAGCAAPSHQMGTKFGQWCLDSMESDRWLTFVRSAGES